MRLNKKQIEAILLAGQRMSNICFNLSQRDGTRLLTPEERRSMKECQQEWDAAYPTK
jgi:hypothetical protein